MNYCLRGVFSGRDLKSSPFSLFIEVYFLVCNYVQMIYLKTSLDGKSTKKNGIVRPP